MQDLRRTFIAGSVWAVLGRVGGAFLYAAVNVVLVRILEPDDVGRFFMCFTVVTAAALCAQSGVNHWIIRALADARQQAGFTDVRKLVRKGVVILISGTLATSAVLYLGLGSFIFRQVFGAPELLPLLPIVILWTASAATLNFVAESFRGLKDFRLASFFAGGQTGGLAALCLTLLIWAILLTVVPEPMLNMLVAGTAAAVGLAAVAAAVVLWRLPGSTSGGAHAAARERAPSRQTLAGSLPAFLIVTLATYVYQQSDLWVLAALSTPAELGVYGSISRLVFLVGLPLMIVNSVVPPIIAELHGSGDAERLEQAVRKLAGFALLLAAPAGLILLIFGKPLLGLVFGPEYTAGYPMLVALAIGKTVNVFAGSCGLVLLMSGQQRIAMRIHLVSATVCVLAAVLVADRFGGLGVAIVFAAGLSLQNFWSVWMARRHVGIRTYAALPSPDEIRRTFTLLRRQS